MTTHFASDPPAELRAQVFPWVEAEIVALDKRMAANLAARDFALKQFLRLLQWLHLVLLQDMAVLLPTHQDAAIFAYPPFNSTAFSAFSAASVSMLAAAKEQSQQLLGNLPQHVADTFSGLLRMLMMNSERD